MTKARRPRPRHVAALLALGLMAAACSAGAPDPTGDGEGGPIPAVNATEAPSLPGTVDALPTFTMADYERLLDELRGTPVVVNVWASWCGPCRIEGPHLVAAHDRVGDRVQFLGIDILDARESARGFLREIGWAYPSVFDPGGQIRDRLGFIGQPVTIFYDAEGQIVSSWTGAIPPEELDARIDELLES